MGRLPIIGVMGSGTASSEGRAERVGRWLGEAGAHLLTGGGGGVMEEVSRAFAEVPNRRGQVIGIIPGSVDSGDYLPKPGYPNRWIEIPIFTHLPLSGTEGETMMSRNHINVLSSDVIVALPGGAGTASEVKLALQYRRPLVAYLHEPEEIPDLPDSVPVERDFDGVKTFLHTFLTARRGGEADA